jgi:hypothetical protein
MYSESRFEVTKGMVVTAPDLLVMDFHTLLAQPIAYLTVADHQCPGALGDRQSIPNMIMMSVRYQDEIRIYFIRLVCRCRIVGEEWIYKNLISARFQQYSCVSQIGKFKIHISLIVSL